MFRAVQVENREPGGRPPRSCRTARPGKTDGDENQAEDEESWEDEERQDPEIRIAELPEDLEGQEREEEEGRESDQMHADQADRMPARPGEQIEKAREHARKALPGWSFGGCHYSRRMNAECGMRGALTARMLCWSSWTV